MLFDNLEGWNGIGGGREVQEGGYICILRADSCCCMAETSTTLQSKYPPVKNFKKETTLAIIITNKTPSIELISVILVALFPLIW